MVKPKYRLRLKNIADFKWIRLIYCFISIKGLIDPTIIKNNKTAIGGIKPVKII